eukprot:138725-Prorocentrum_minimum.AAC.2
MLLAGSLDCPMRLSSALSSALTVLCKEGLAGAETLLRVREVASVIGSAVVAAGLLPPRADVGLGMPCAGAGFGVNCLLPPARELGSTSLSLVEDPRATAAVFTGATTLALAVAFCASIATRPCNRSHSARNRPFSSSKALR